MKADGQFAAGQDDLEAWRPGTPAGPLLKAAWSVRRSLPVRITGFDVARIASRTWGETHAVLRARGVSCGPVLVVVPRACVEVAVPLGTAARWPALPTTCCVAGAVVRCPAPSINAREGLQVSGRTWLHPPMPDPQVPDVTDDAALADAVRTALARLADQPHPPYDREGIRP